MSEDVPPYGDPRRRRPEKSRRHHSDAGPPREDRFEFIGKRLTLIVAIIVPLFTAFMLWRAADLQYKAAKEAVNQQRESLNQQYVSMAIGLLAKAPTDDIGRALRGWEVDVFMKFAPVPISPAVEQSLREGAAIPLRGDAVTGTGSVGTIH
jgi:hypothetical protein